MENKAYTNDAGHLLDAYGNTHHPYYEWVAPAFLDHQRGFLWYFLIVSVFSSLSVWFVFQQDFLPAFMIGLLQVVILLYSLDSSKDIVVRLTSDTFLIGGVSYDVSLIDKFWFTHLGERSVLHFTLRRGLNRDVRVFLGTMDVMTLRTAMGIFATEDTQKEGDFFEWLGAKVKL